MSRTALMMRGEQSSAAYRHDKRFSRGHPEGLARICRASVIETRRCSSLTSIPRPRPFASIGAATFAEAGAKVPQMATSIAEKVDAAGRHAGQVELCDRHCDFVINRERNRVSRSQTGEMVACNCCTDEMRVRV